MILWTVNQHRNIHLFLKTHRWINVQPDYDTYYYFHGILNEVFEYYLERTELSMSARNSIPPGLKTRNHSRNNVTFNGIVLKEIQICHITLHAMNIFTCFHIAKTIIPISTSTMIVSTWSLIKQNDTLT